MTRKDRRRKEEVIRTVGVREKNECQSESEDLKEARISEEFEW